MSPFKGRWIEGIVTKNVRKMVRECYLLVVATLVATYLASWKPLAFFSDPTLSLTQN